ncbi:MAG: methyltransferase domain-containing protein [Bdellovibrionaceae bacterium]|jgi:SAM-dependent methyltransferase|nr:methyltransferase domain-containing protein [Pseudobdellovibrionaceae bacterium]
MSEIQKSDGHKYIQINEYGVILDSQGPIKNPEEGLFYLEKMQADQGARLFTESLSGDELTVEAFDAPYVVLSLSEKNQKIIMHMSYEFHMEMPLDHLFLDDWDRFHGVSHKGVPFVLTGDAQNQLFDLLDEFDDDFIIYKNKKYRTPNWLVDRTDVNADDFWTNRYVQSTPPWELNEATPALTGVLPQLKLTKLRVIVLGSGSGCDAAYLAERGHIVTAVDFSDEALRQAKEKYGHINNLEFVKADIFELPDSYKESFDLVFEHTCYCAVSPQRRNDLVKVWKGLLSEGGHFLGVFFTRYFPKGPPYGGNEWEYRKRLEPNFKTLYWTRWRQSVSDRQGIELVVYAQKKG